MSKTEYAYRVYMGMQSRFVAPTVYMISTPLAWRLMKQPKDVFYIVLDKDDGGWKLTNSDLSS